VTQGEPSLVATFVAEQIDVAWTIGRGLPIPPSQEFSRSVTRNPVCGPVTVKELRELLPVVRRFDGEFRRLPPEKLQNWTGTSAKDPCDCRCNTTRSPCAHQGWKHDVKSQGETVLRFRIRHCATARRPPTHTGRSVARSGRP